MKTYTYTGKTRSEALNLALYELNVNEDEVYVKETEQKGSLFKSKKVELTIIKQEDVANLIKEFLTSLIEKMGLEIKIETSLREGVYNFTIFSDNNAILIGKEGRTISALNQITRQMLNNEISFRFRYNLDVGLYKQKQENNLERMAKKVAREVAKTKLEAKLEPMNSYERRIVHNALTNDRFVYTESAGEDPERYVVIKLKKNEEKTKEEE